MFENLSNKKSRFVDIQKKFITLINDYSKKILNEHIEMIRVKKRLKLLMKNFEKKNRLLTNETIVFNENYKAMIDNKKNTKNV